MLEKKNQKIYIYLILTTFTGGISLISKFKSAQENYVEAATKTTMNFVPKICRKLMPLLLPLLPLPILPAWMLNLLPEMTISESALFFLVFVTVLYSDYILVKRVFVN